MLKPKFLVNEYIENKDKKINFLNMLEILEPFFLNLFNLMNFYKTQYNTKGINFTYFEEIKKLLNNTD